LRVHFRRTPPRTRPVPDLGPARVLLGVAMCIAKLLDGGADAAMLAQARGVGGKPQSGGARPTSAKSESGSIETGSYSTLREQAVASSHSGSVPSPRNLEFLGEARSLRSAWSAGDGAAAVHSGILLLPAGARGERRGRDSDSVARRGGPSASADFRLDIRWSELDDDEDDDEDIQAVLRAFAAEVRATHTELRVKFREIDGDYIAQQGQLQAPVDAAEGAASSSRWSTGAC